MPPDPAVSRRGRLGFVPPRYGPKVVGGAEQVVAELAHGLAGRGWEVEVLTTCAVDHFTWANEEPPGESRDGDVLVRRFPTVVDTGRAERAAIGAAIHAGAPVPITEQQRWANDDLRVPELYHYLLDHAADYRALVFAPYLFWTTFACGQVAPERTILMTCLHDEPEARLDVFRPLVEGAAGIWFLADPERDLAASLFRLPRHEVVGAGVIPPGDYDPAGFRARHGLGEHRYVLYAGRREGAKNWEATVEAFARATHRFGLPFRLLTMGTGEVNPPADIADRVVDLGFLPGEERHHAFAVADAYLQPSAYESFSRTVMEAWLAGTPVLANAASAVVSWHVERSGAGLLYDDEAEFAECLRFVAEEPAAARALAEPGRAYVLEHYDPDAVLDRVESTLEAWR